MISFNPPKTFVRHITTTGFIINFYFFYFYRWENWDLERLRDLSKIIQLLSCQCPFSCFLTCNPVSYVSTLSTTWLHGFLQHPQTLTVTELQGYNTNLALQRKGRLILEGNAIHRLRVKEEKEGRKYYIIIKKIYWKETVWTTIGKRMITFAHWQKSWW